MKDGKEIINDFLTEVAQGSEHIIEVTNDILKDGQKKMTFAMQKREIQPEQPKQLIKKESPRRAHKLYSVGSFVDYLKANKSDKTVVLADVINNTIEAILDDSAKNGFEVIEFRPQTHPLFSKWENKIIGRNVEVLEFAKFLQQNKKTVSSPDAMELTYLFSQIRASQKITMHKGIGKGSVNGLTCEVNITGQGNENQEVDMPDVIKLNVPIYVDTDYCDVELDILLEASNTDVFVCCSSSDLDVRRIEAFENMLNQIREIDDIVVGFGSSHTKDWDYLTSSNRSF